MKNRDAMKLLERAERRLKSYQGIAKYAIETKQDVVLDPREMFEPEDASLLRDIQEAISQSRGVMPLPFAQEA